MEPTTQSPPTAAQERSETGAKPLPATERDFRTRPSRTASPGFRIALVIAVIVLLVVGLFIYRYVTSYESTDDAQVDGHVNSISARISGHVVKLNVQDNQFVQGGTVLVEIDPTDYRVALERAKADFEDARALAIAAGVDVPITSVSTASQLSSAQAEADSTRAGIQAARQQSEAAKAQFQQAEANEAARANADAALQQVSQAQSKLAQAEANWRNANTAPKQMTAMRAKAASAEAEVQRKKADLDQAQLNLQYTKIVAPVAGVVSDRTVEIGQNVVPGQELMKVIPLDDIWITANFKETQLRNIRVSQPVTVEVDANGRKYKGKVDSIAGASGARFSLLPPENATGNYVKVVQRIPVKIVLEPGENQDHQLRPGMSVVPKVWIR